MTLVTAQRLRLRELPPALASELSCFNEVGFSWHRYYSFIVIKFNQISLTMKASLSHKLITPVLPHLIMVSVEGFEPSILSASELKSDVYASSTTRPYLKQISVVISNVAISITSWVVRISLLMHLFNQDHLGTTPLVISCWHLLLVESTGLEPVTLLSMFYVATLLYQLWANSPF